LYAPARQAIFLGEREDRFVSWLRSVGIVPVVLLATAELGTSLAHPGHGTEHALSPTHYLLEPTHALSWLGGLLAAIGLLVLGRRRRSAE
jgi:LPXTG-motif cell wall-anchored protein